MEYGLIGKPLGHSFSPELHKKIGAYSYDLCELEEEELDRFFDEKTGQSFKGINVTIPYKQKVMKYLSKVEESASLIGAVNTVVKVEKKTTGGENKADQLSENATGKAKIKGTCEAEFELVGYNTDILGFLGTLERQNVNLCGKKVVILGSGGTSKMFCGAAVLQKAREILIVSRDPARLKKGLQKEKKAGEKPIFSYGEIITYDALYEKHLDAEILLNGTPVGMFPKEDGWSAKIGRLKNLEFVFDAIYHPLRTNLILAAQKRGIKAVGGLYMLVRQGMESARLFGENTRDIETVYHEVLNDKMNLVLIGMPSCGKSFIGKLISENVGKPFVDTDELFEETYKCSAGDFIRNFGEKAFRRREKNICKIVAKMNGVIISTGGGMPLYKDNGALLKRNGPVVYLRRTLSELAPSESRPLSSDESKLAELFAARGPRYEAVADIIIDGTQSAKETEEMILAATSKWEES